MPIQTYPKIFAVICDAMSHEGDFTVQNPHKMFSKRNGKVEAKLVEIIQNDSTSKIANTITQNRQESESLNHCMLV